MRMFKSEGSARRTVLLALTLVAVLSVSLVVRLMVRGPASPRVYAQTEPPPAWLEEPAEGYVPPPRRVSPTELPMPGCWSCSGAPSIRGTNDRPADLEFDLDLIAPLGDGPGNLAVWWKDFQRLGPRVDEIHVGKIDWVTDGHTRQIYAPDSSLLLEAEGWADQARCSFYPEVWQFEGESTEIPNLLPLLAIGQSFIARGEQQEDREAAEEDYRRVVRLGRLLLQDDFTVIQELVGLALIRWGSEALYEEARRAGDAEHMLLAALARGDVSGMGQRWHEWVAEIPLPSTSFIGKSLLGGGLLSFEEDELKRLFEIGRGGLHRPLRLEALMWVRLVDGEGSRAQRLSARALLEELADDPDEVIAAAAQWSLEHPVDRKTFFEVFKDA